MVQQKRGSLAVLVEAGIITDEMAGEIRASGEVGVWRVLRVLERGVDEEKVAETLSAAFEAPRLGMIRAWPDAGDLIDEKLVKLRYCAPLRQLPDGRIALAMLDPSDRASIDDVRIETRCEVAPMTVTRTELDRLWGDIYPPPVGFRAVIAQLYLGMTVSEDDDVQRLLNLLLLQSNLDDDAIIIDWSAGEVDISGLCEASTRATDRLLAQKLTQRLRVLTESPPPASLGGLTLRTSSDGPPVHFLVHFAAESTAVESVLEAVFRTYF